MRYFGGKWRLAPWIIAQFPDHRTYTEAFGGAGSVLIRKPRAYAEVYNDLDGEVVNLFRVLQDRVTGKRLQELLELTPYAREEFERAYEPTDDPLERARRTVIKAFMGFGSNAVQVDSPRGRGFNTRVSTEKTGRSTGFRTGDRGGSSRASTGFRADSNRSGTTPAHDWKNYPATLPALIDRLQGVVIENRDAHEILQRFDRPDTLHYVDPPYVHSTRQNARRDRYRFEMTDEQHRELAEVLKGLSGMVAVGGYPSELYGELYDAAGWVCVQKDTVADRARARVEVLWLNPAAARRRTGRLFE